MPRAPHHQSTGKITAPRQWECDPPETATVNTQRPCDILQPHIHLAEPVFAESIRETGTLTKSIAIIMPAKESTN